MANNGNGNNTNREFNDKLINDKLHEVNDEKATFCLMLSLSIESLFRIPSISDSIFRNSGWPRSTSDAASLSRSAIFSSMAEAELSATYRDAGGWDPFSIRLLSSSISQCNCL